MIPSQSLLFFLSGKFAKSMGCGTNGSPCTIQKQMEKGNKKQSGMSIGQRLCMTETTRGGSKWLCSAVGQLVVKYNLVIRLNDYKGYYYYYYYYATLFKFISK